MLLPCTLASLKIKQRLPCRCQCKCWVTSNLHCFRCPQEELAVKLSQSLDSSVVSVMSCSLVLVLTVSNKDLLYPTKVHLTCSCADTMMNGRLKYFISHQAHTSWLKVSKQKHNNIIHVFISQWEPTLGS